MKKSFFFALIVFQFITAQTAGSLKSKIDYLIAEKLSASSQVAIDIYDLTDKEILYRKNHELLFRPASNMKLFTTATALVFLGTEYKVATNVYHNGFIRDSVCYGDIIIVGACDPLFTDKHLDTLVSQIKSSGIKKITGNLIGDISCLDSLYWGSGWMWDDNPYPFSPYLTPLVVNESSIKIEFKPGPVGYPVEIKFNPEIKNYFNIANSSLTVKEDSNTIEISRDWINNNNNIIINGKLKANSTADTVQLNLIHPENFFLNLFKQKLQEQEVELAGKIEVGKLQKEISKIAFIETGLNDIILKTNKDSHNLSAEMILRIMGAECFEKPASAKKGIKLIDSLVASIPMDPKNYKLVDGSGLSFYNLVSAELITELLKYIYSEKQEIFKLFYESLPVAGIDGTLEKRMTNSAVFNNVRAKTGTLSGVSCLSGYLTTSNNHLIAFSIMNQNYVGSSKKTRTFQDKLCKILVKEK
ncbi:MAG: D-alanyl-D-alanine carboxypeptidase/D-alanyl-D-alanine-endopeptidase [Ignavibacteria bacterium]|jgi:D-alanyl-D-alanine carboxypeptidase/D-alanyl-D-alanine-endopeptidase (penicillin-binding protein 4)